MLIVRVIELVIGELYMVYIIGNKSVTIIVNDIFLIKKKNIKVTSKIKTRELCSLLSAQFTC